MHREGAWTAESDEEALRRLRPTDWPRLACEGTVLTAVTGLAAGLGMLVAAPVPIGAAVFFVGGFGLLSRRKDDQTFEDREKVVALREEFGLGPVWMVELMVRQGEAPTGRDQGLMWIEQGRMMYSGLRTSFAIVPSQVETAVCHQAGTPGIKLRLNLELARRTPAGLLSISFWPIADGVQRAENDAEGLRYALNTVLDAGRWTKRPELEGQWPPVTIGPGALPPKELKRTIFIRAGAASAIAAWIGICVGTQFPLEGLGLFLGIGLAFNAVARAMNASLRKAYADAKKVWGPP